MTRSLPHKAFEAVLGVAAFAACLSAGSQSPASTARASVKAKAPLFAEAPDRDLVVRVCTPCHAPEQVIAKHHTADEWDAIIGKMIDRGAQANEAQQDRIFAYLVRFYGP
jgi:uncharacterized membrane protein